MDIVVISDGNRGELLTQTLESIDCNSIDRHHVGVFMEDRNNPRGVGGLKNHGVGRIRRTSPYVFFSDDDMYYLHGWDVKMQQALEASGITQLCAWSHPYNHVTDLQEYGTHTIGSVTACHGGAFIMRWEDWDRWGPFVDNAVGPGMSEDVALSRRIVDGGGRIGCVVPFVAVHCGISNCLGKMAVGAKEMRELAEAQLRAHNLKGKVIVR